MDFKDVDDHETIAGGREGTTVPGAAILVHGGLELHSLVVVSPVQGAEWGDKRHCKYGYDVERG